MAAQGRSRLLRTHPLILRPGFDGSEEFGADGWVFDGGVGRSEAEEFRFGEAVDCCGHWGFLSVGVIG